MDIMRGGQNDDASIEISAAPDLYLVEFTFGRQPNERVSIILPATCGLAAMTRAWTLFPEYKRGSRTSVHPVKWVEIDWREEGRIIIVKQRQRADIPVSTVQKPNNRKRKKNDVESGE